MAVLGAGVESGRIAGDCAVAKLAKEIRIADTKMKILDMPPPLFPVHSVALPGTIIQPMRDQGSTATGHPIEGRLARGMKIFGSQYHACTNASLRLLLEQRPALHLKPG